MDVSSTPAYQQLKTTGMQDSLCSLDPIIIPRPKFVGMEYVPTAGRFGYYQSLRKKEADSKKSLANVFPPDYDQPKLDDSNKPLEFRRLGENFQKIMPTETKLKSSATDDRVDNGKKDSKPLKGAKKEVKFADTTELVQ